MATGSDDNDLNDYPPQTTYRSYRRRWFGLIQLVLLNIMVSWDWLSFAPVTASAATYYAVSSSAINSFSIVVQFSFLATAPLSVVLLKRGIKPSVTVAATLMLLGNWIRFAGSHSHTPAGGARPGCFGAVMFGQVLCGLAQPFVLAAPTKYSDLWFSPQGRVAATALASLANPLGAALAQLANPFFVTRSEDVSSMVLYVAVMTTVCAVPAYFIPSRPPTPVGPHATCSSPVRLLPSLRIAFSSLEVWLILVPFWFYAGLFNSSSSLLNQMMLPYGFSDDQAGIGGAILIVVGLVASAISSPILDRTKQFLAAIKVFAPVVALSYLAFVWMPATRSVAGPYAVLAVQGASSFALLPVALEFLSELTYPVDPSITSTMAWAGCQLFGGCFIFISDALQAGADADPSWNMNHALVFQAVIALLVVPLPLSLGLFGWSSKVKLRRLQSDVHSSTDNSDINM